MSSTGYDEKIQFRASAEKSAAETLDSVHVGGVNVSELAREGLREMLRRVVTEEDKVHIYERYSEGEIDEDVARLLLGEELDELSEDAEAFQRAMDADTSEMFQE